MNSAIYYQGKPLAQASGEVADSLRLLLSLYLQRRSFRSLNHPPFITPLPGYDYIECTTGGSSGIPKVIRRRLTSWIGSFDVNQQRFHLNQDDRYAVLGDLNHSLALYAVCESLHLGLAIDILSGMRPRAQLERMTAQATRVLYVTPTQLRLLTALHVPCHTVRLILCGGSKLDPLLRRQAMRCFPGAELYEFYGASETSFITLADAQTPEGSVGKAYPGVNIEIRHRQGDIGEVWVNSPYLFENYCIGGSDDTRQSAGYLTVGELGRLDDQGYLWLSGRKSRMVTSSDKNVYPESVETLISQHIGQALCAVIAHPDPLRGHVLHAFIEGDNHAGSERSLRAAIRQQLGEEMEPRRFFYLPALPLLASGKPDLKKLESYPLS